MFKKVALIGLISISSLLPMNIDGADVEQRHTHECGKVSLWFKAIIPSILSYASLEWFVRANRNNPDRHQLVENVKYAQWAPFIIGCYCLNLWMDTDFKEWSLSKPTVPDQTH